MGSFLGVPVRVGEASVFGNLYLTEKRGRGAASPTRTRTS